MFIWSISEGVQKLVMIIQPSRVSASIKRVFSVAGKRWIVGWVIAKGILVFSNGE